jgi:hypothetical protein
MKQLDYEHETGSRYLLRHRDDPDKELMLTVLCFNVPTEWSRSSRKRVPLGNPHVA